MTKKSKKTGNYEIGYKKPPKATRFQPGESGNRLGRPKKPRSSNEILEKIMSEKVTIVIKGRRRTVTMKEVLIRQLVTEGMKGNQRALKAIFNRETERILDEDARLAEQKKHHEEISKGMDEIFKRIEARKAKEEAAKKEKQMDEKGEDGLAVNKKNYDPDA